MTTASPKWRIGTWIQIGVVAIVILSPVACVLSTTIPRELADREIEPRCKIECGMKIFEKAQLESHESIALEKIDWAAREKGRAIGEKFHLKQSSIFTQPYGVSVYKYTEWIERNADAKRMSEITWYFRQGDEIFHGKHFPSARPNYEQLIAETLTIALPNPSLQDGPAASSWPVELTR